MTNGLEVTDANEEGEGHSSPAEAQRNDSAYLFSIRRIVIYIISRLVHILFVNLDPFVCVCLGYFMTGRPTERFFLVFFLF